MIRGVIWGFRDGMVYPSDQDYPSGDPGHHKIDLSSDNVSLALNSLFGDMMTLSPKTGTDLLVPENGDRIVSPKIKITARLTLSGENNQLRCSGSRQAHS